MYVLFEDSGNFKAEKIFSDSDTTMQVDSASGKRSKIKKNSVLFTFEQTAPAELLEKAAAQIVETDYAKRFSDSGKPVSLLPVVFDYQDERAVIEWKELSTQ